MDNRITVAKFVGYDRIAYTAPLWRYDYGQELTIEGLDLPSYFEVHFSNALHGNSKTSVYSDGSCIIPDEYLQNSGTVYAWIYLHDTNDDGETEYQIVTQVRERAKPTNAEPTPVQQDTIEQTIAALENAVEECEDNVSHYPKIENGYWYVWDAVNGEWVNTDVPATGPEGPEGPQGPDGYSPSASVTKSGSVATITITDKSGTTTASVSDGDPTDLIDNTTTEAWKTWSSSKISSEDSLKMDKQNPRGSGYLLMNVDPSLGVSSGCASFGMGNRPMGASSFCCGSNNEADGIDSFASGTNTNAATHQAHAEGYGTLASHVAAHAEGNTTTASGQASHSEGDNTVASGSYSHAEGKGTTASRACAHAEGYGAVASEQDAHAEGDYTTSSGHAAHAEGSSAIASGYASHAEGYNTTASGGSSHAQGYETVAASDNQFVFGCYNVEDDQDQYMEIAGNGSSLQAKNARTLDWDGNEVLAGKLTIGGTPSVDNDVARLIDLKNEILKIYPSVSTSGAVAHIEVGADGLPMKSVVCEINAVQSGTGDPSPSNVRPISGWSSVEVKKTGVNIVDISTIASGNVSYSDGELSGTASAFNSAYSADGFFSLPSGNVQYTVSLSAYTTNGNTSDNGLVCRFKYKDGTQDSVFFPNNTTSYTRKTLTSNASKEIESLIFTYSAKPSNTWKVKDLQIEVGSTATTYEPYTATVIPITWQTQAGTVYGGSLDVTSGVLRVTHGTCTYTGANTEAWGTDTSSGLRRFYTTISDANAGSTSARNSIIANIGKFNANSADDTVGTIFIRNASGAARMYYIPEQIPTDVPTFRTWLASNNLQVYYELATPVTYQLTAQQVNSLLGVNNVWHDANGETSITARADIGLLINSL